MKGGTTKPKEKKLREFILRRFLVSQLRRSFKKTPMYSRALTEAKEEFFVESKHGALMRRVHFTCAKCGRKFLNKTGTREIAVDHVDPVINPDVGFVDWDTYIDRLFNGRLQVLCNYSGLRDGVLSCHHQKTQSERAILKVAKNKLKMISKNININVSE